MNETVLWQALCVFCLFLFLTAAALTALTVKQKKYQNLWACVPLLCLSYFAEQCFDCRVSGAVFSDGAARLIDGLFSLPCGMLLLLCLLLATAEALMLRGIRRYERAEITPMSVKEAMDSLPAGILCYAPEAKVLLANYSMRDFCRRVSGDELEDGESFAEKLREGTLLPGCRRVAVGDEQLLVLPDGTAWKLSEADAVYEGHPVRMLFSSDVSEEYGKMLELQSMQKKVEELGERLQKVNREIVELTSEREILNAKVRIHDEFGSNLLAIRRFLTNGGTDEDKAELAEMLRRNVSFLKNDSSSAVRDEYELLISMGKRLGVSILITGSLPQKEPNKAIMATAIHECLTNTLRHAHGDTLRVVVSEEKEFISAVFTNNGDQPGTGIREKGGLASLRELAEQAGGTMTVSCQPVFSVTITLPRGEDYGI